MSETRPFDSFIDLISFDQKLHMHELDIKKQERVIAGLEEEKELLDSELELAKGALHDARKEVDEKELEMKDLESQEADKKKRMEQVANQKEYQSIKHELESIGARQLALEDVLVLAWNQLEVTQKKYEVVKSDYEQKVKALDDQIRQAQTEIVGIQNLLDEQKKKRAAKEELVPEEWLEKYTIMRARIPDPVVPVVEGSCSSCFHQLTDQDLIQINRNKLLQCKGCYRFLYNESLEQKQAAG